MKHAQPTLRKPVRRDRGGQRSRRLQAWCDAPRAVVASPHLVRASDAAGPGLDESEQDLAEVHCPIVQLQRSLAAHRLTELATYVSALRQRVEERLA